MRAEQSHPTREASIGLDHREPEAGAVDPMFPDRWSPRAFREEPVPEADLEALFEASRWAPSSFNEQPWHFVYAREEDDRERFLEAILEGNRSWARRAPVLAFVVADPTFEHNGDANRHAEFDAGAAWMSLALQARRLGLDTHAMGGIDPDKAAELLAVPDDHRVLCAVAIGYRAEPDVLPDELAEDELPPSSRKPLEAVRSEGTFDA